MTHPPGAVLHNRYRIVKMLGQGGFGTMYRAWDTVLGRVSALKENLDVAAPVQRQFLREAKILANLSHPNLPRVTDYFIEGSGQYLVMDFVDGRDLQEMLEDRGGPLPEDQVLGWIRQICDALAYMHAQNPPVIHRDIKPGNIKIAPDDRAVLLDFGIAKVFDTRSKTTQGAQAVSPGFSPYEQYGKAATDVRSDVYALGATLYTLLTATEPPESVQRVTRDPLALARQLNPNISVRTGSAVMRALQMDPTQRFQSVSDFKAALSPPVRPAPPARPAPQAYSTAPQPPYSPAKIASPAPPGAGATKTPAIPGWVSGVALLLLTALLVVVINNRRSIMPAEVASQAAPGSQTVPAAPTMESTDTRLDTPTPPSATGTPGTRSPTRAPLVYIVQAGDTCSEIADFYDVSVLVIAGYNQLPPDCGVIYAGQRLLIPQIEGMPALTPTPKFTATPSRTATPRQPISTFIMESDSMVQVYVPAGEFLMGALPGDVDASRAERPHHTVFLRAYWIDQTEVTNEMYARCVSAGACRSPEKNTSSTRLAYFGQAAYAAYPVIFVAWDDARAYCAWAGRRLPREAEWERAARGDSGGRYPWGDQAPSPQLANFDQNSGDTRPVGSYPQGASLYGALDMAGNVAEWVADWFAEDAYENSLYANPTGPENGEFRVIRGGSWYNGARAMRTVFRLWNYPELRSDTVGFRCAR